MNRRMDNVTRAKNQHDFIHADEVIMVATVAFGMGIDRIALLLHQISDIRLLSENNVRFLEQFKSHL